MTVPTYFYSKFMQLLGNEPTGFLADPEIDLSGGATCKFATVAAYLNPKVSPF